MRAALLVLIGCLAGETQTDATADAAVDGDDAVWLAVDFEPMSLSGPIPVAITLDGPGDFSDFELVRARTD